MQNDRKPVTSTRVGAVSRSARIQPAAAPPNKEQLRRDSTCACGGNCPRCAGKGSAGGSVRYTNETNARLPPGTPAWTEEGTTYLSWPWLLSDASQRERILRHETVHALQHRNAGRNEDSAHRSRAESLAEKAESGSFRISAEDLEAPVPALLGAAPRDMSPWTRVWVGKTGVVAEVESNSIIVRLYMSYDLLGLKGGEAPATFACGPFSANLFEKQASKMQAVAAQTAAMNAYIPASAASSRVAMIFIHSDPYDKAQSHYRTANGKGAMRLSLAEWENGVAADTIAHEGAHAIFDSYLANNRSGRSEASGFALQVASLYSRLQSTKAVPKPDRQFDPKSPPSLVAPAAADEAAVTYPAGVIMVYDTLWGDPGGHPWDNMDEFFASAFAGYVRQPARLALTMDFYERFDPTIKPLRKELGDLLSVAKDPTKASLVNSPADTEAARNEMAKVADAADMMELETNAELGWLVDPGTMSGPRSMEINCEARKRLQEMLDEGKPP